eukprot:scaffold109821_cov63-Phaeocystis_antarctica.AAC.4
MVADRAQVPGDRRLARVAAVDVLRAALRRIYRVRVGRLRALPPLRSLRGHIYAIGHFDRRCSSSKVVVLRRHEPQQRRTVRRRLEQKYQSASATASANHD